MKKTTRLTALLLALVLLLGTLSASATETGFPLEDLDMETYSTMLTTASDTAGGVDLTQCGDHQYCQMVKYMLEDCTTAQARYEYLMSLYTAPEDIPAGEESNPEYYQLENVIWHYYWCHVADREDISSFDICTCSFPALEPDHVPGDISVHEEDCPWHFANMTVEEQYPVIMLMGAEEQMAYLRTLSADQATALNTYALDQGNSNAPILTDPCAADNPYCQIIVNELAHMDAFEVHSYLADLYTKGLAEGEEGPSYEYGALLLHYIYYHLDSNLICTCGDHPMAAPETFEPGELSAHTEADCPWKFCNMPVEEQATVLMMRSAAVRPDYVATLSNDQQSVLGSYLGSILGSSLCDKTTCPYADIINMSGFERYEYLKQLNEEDPVYGYLDICAHLRAAHNGDDVICQCDNFDISNPVHGYGTLYHTSSSILGYEIECPWNFTLIPVEDQYIVYSGLTDEAMKQEYMDALEEDQKAALRAYIDSIEADTTCDGSACYEHSGGIFPETMNANYQTLISLPTAGERHAYLNSFYSTTGTDVSSSGLGWFYLHLATEHAELFTNPGLICICSEFDESYGGLPAPGHATGHMNNACPWHPDNYQPEQPEQPEEIHQGMMEAITEEEFFAFLDSMTEDEIDAFHSALTEQQLADIQNKLNAIQMGYGEFALDEIAGFTEGFLVGGSNPQGSELRSILFGLSAHEFDVAVNQMDIDQAGSLEAVVTEAEGLEIVDSMVHYGFDVTGMYDNISASSASATYGLRMASPMVYAAADAEGTADYVGPVWPNEGAIYVDKTAAAVAGEDNLYEVTLTIEGKNFKAPSDVVLVMDTSGSMADDKKYSMAEDAAIAFGEKLLVEGSETRIAIVTFAQNATAYNSGHFYTASELEDFKTAIKSIYGKTMSGGTNQQAGLHAADLLLTSAAANRTDGKTALKNIVILSDGEATYFHPFTGTAKRTGCYVGPLGYHHTSNSSVSDYSITGCDYDTVIGGGRNFTFDYNTIVDIECAHNRTTQEQGVSNGPGTSFSTTGRTNCGVNTIWEADQIKAKDTSIFSVALLAGTNGSNVLRECATDASKGFYDITSTQNVGSHLTEAFEAIAGSIAIAARNGSVVDIMGEKVAISNIGTGDVTYTNDLAAYQRGEYDVYLSQGQLSGYDPDSDPAETLSWDVGSINESVYDANGNIITDNTAVMRYKVYITDTNVTTGTTVPTNTSATFNYTDYQGVSASKTFPIPQVTVGGGTIIVHWYRVDESGKPMNAEGVTEGVTKDKAEVLKPQEYLLNSEGNAGLSYGEHTVTADAIEDFVFYGYNVNDGVLVTDSNQVKVTLDVSHSNQHVWLAYYEQKDGALTINKVVQNSEFTSGTFNFTIVSEDVSKTASIELNNSKTGSATVEGLPEGTYTITETGAEGYNTTIDGVLAPEKSATVTITAGATTTVNVINTATGTANITATKVWDDNNDALDHRPESVDLTITGNGQTYSNTGIALVTDGNTWTYTFEVPKYDANGNVTTYTADEANVPAYYNKSTSGLTVTNTLNVGHLRITKSGLREGDSAIFTVKIAGQPYTTVVLTGGVNGAEDSVLLVDLPAGKAYEVIEDSSWTARYSIDTTSTGMTGMTGMIAMGQTAEAKIVNKYDEGKWLDDEGAAENVFTGAKDN